MSKLGQRMIAAVEDALAFAEGRDSGVVMHDFPDVRAVRARLGLTQPGFAERFGLPVGSVRDWEQGRVVPDGAARVLLRVIERAPHTVARAAARKPAPAAKPPVARKGVGTGANRPAARQGKAGPDEPATQETAAKKIGGSGGVAKRAAARKPADRKPASTGSCGRRD